MSSAFVQRRLQVVVFYPADWDPECQAILSAFSALSDQFASCHVSMQPNLNWMGEKVSDIAHARQRYVITSSQASKLR